MVTTCENAQYLLILLGSTIINRLAFRIIYVCICMTLALSSKKNKARNSVLVFLQ